MGRGKREERPFPAFSLFPRPSRAFYFFIIAILLLLACSSLRDSRVRGDWEGGNMEI